MRDDLLVRICVSPEVYPFRLIGQGPRFHLARRTVVCREEGFDPQFLQSWRADRIKGEHAPDQAELHPIHRQLQRRVARRLGGTGGNVTVRPDFFNQRGKILVERIVHRLAVTGDRVGARRTCKNPSGQRWSEDVIEWDDAARTLTLQFDAEAPDFPLPVTEMYGGWSVEGAGDHADVTVWYQYTVPGGLLGEVAAPLVAQRFRGMMEAVISNMEAEAQRIAGVTVAT